MKNVFLISLASVLLFSCVNDDRETYQTVKKVKYRIVSFYSENHIPIDLDNDGIARNDIMLELEPWDYFTDYGYDMLEVRTGKDNKKRVYIESGESFFHIDLPIQYFGPQETYEPHPTRVYAFDREVYGIKMSAGKSNIGYIDDDNSILSFLKIPGEGNNYDEFEGYEAIIEKRYYDFASSSFVKFKFKVEFKKIDDEE